MVRSLYRFCANMADLVRILLHFEARSSRLHGGQCFYLDEHLYSVL